MVPQEDTLDVELTVRENLLVYGRYFGLPEPVIRQRADALLDSSSSPTGPTPRSTRCPAA